MPDVVEKKQPARDDPTVVGLHRCRTHARAAIDYHGNSTSSQPINVHTPATGGIDPRRTGVRTNGAYWGGNGEQIDLLSGNLNFTLPLIRAQGRGGWGVTLSLNYNSANFRKDTAATWKMGRDSGYGFGWKFLAGSITPYYDNWYSVHHYVFTDSTGAEYRLNQQSNGIWYSQESIYVRYDPSKNQLYFPDGSFWEFGALSAGIEEDSGTLYPTKMQDTNGNFIAISYQTGTYALDPQSSSRITVIEDSRAISLYGTNYGNVNGTFWLNYTTDLAPHLTSINSISAVGLGYTFTMAGITSLNSPFAGDYSTFGSTSRLDTITGAYGLQHNMQYNSNNSCELSKVTFPYGGSLAWQFRDFTFSDSRIIRDMQYRWLNDTINGNQQYAFYHDETHDYNTSNHSDTTVVDASNISAKNWKFDNDTGLQSRLMEYSITGSNWAFVRDAYIYWSTDSDGNPYISTNYNYLDPYGPNQMIARTDQTRDKYGNLTQMKVYDYGSTTTSVRTYNNTYANLGSYINNRLATSTVTEGGTTITLASNIYDQLSASGTNGGCGLWGAVYGGTPSNAREFDPTYNGNGSVRGNLTTAGTPDSIRCMFYDAAGIVLQTKDGLGHTVTQTPDSTHNYAVPSAITTGNLTSTMTWNGAFQPTGATNPNGATTGLAYDAYARPASSTSPYGAVTSVSYTNSPPTSTTTINGRWSKTTMDGFGRAVKVEIGYGTTTLSITETTYAPCGCTPIGKTKQVSVPRAPGGPTYWTVLVSLNLTSVM